jgi:hypothetical protein
MCASGSKRVLGAKAEIRVRLVAIIQKISSQPSPATTTPHAHYIYTFTMGLAGQKKYSFLRINAI